MTNQLSTSTLRAILDDPFAEIPPDPRIRLPSEVSDRISYTAWTGLSRMIWDNYVPNQKWLMSQTEGHDIGVAETVRRMVEDNPLNSRGIDYLVRMRVTKDESKEFKRLLIIGCLLGTDFVTENMPPVNDDHGPNQLVGELRRYWATTKGIARPETIQLTREVINDYCTTYQLNDASERFAKKLGI